MLKREQHPELFSNSKRLFGTQSCYLFVAGEQKRAQRFQRFLCKPRTKQTGMTGAQLCLRETTLHFNGACARGNPMPAAGSKMTRKLGPGGQSQKVGHQSNL